MQEAIVNRTPHREVNEDPVIPIALKLTENDELKRQERFNVNLQIDLRARQLVSNACASSPNLYEFEESLSRIVACEMRGSFVYRQSNLLDKRYFNDAEPGEQQVLLDEAEAIADLGDSKSFLDRLKYLKGRHCFRAVPLASKVHVGEWEGDENIELGLEEIRQKSFYEPVEKEISVGVATDGFLLFTTKQTERICEDQISDIYLKKRQAFALNLSAQPGVESLIDKMNQLDDDFERLLKIFGGRICDMLWGDPSDEVLDLKKRIDLSPDFISENPELSNVLENMKAKKTQLREVLNRRIEVLLKGKDPSVIPISTEVRLRHDLKEDYSEKSAHNKVASFSLSQAGLLKIAS